MELMTGKVPMDDDETFGVSHPYAAIDE